MEKLQMCRICLVENVRMFLVVNKDLHQLYEKLTENPFVTEDSRPHLACYFCCAKLKQCFRFLKKCLEAEELFAQMMDKEYEPNLSVNPQHLDLCNGFTISHIEHITIIDKHQTRIVSIKEELPAVCERLHDAIETNEIRSIGLLPDNMCHIFLNVDDILPAHSESDSEDDVPSVAIPTEVEEGIEVVEKEQEDVEIDKLEPNVGNTSLDHGEILLEHSKSDSEDVSILEVTAEVSEKQRTLETNGTPFSRAKKLEDITETETYKKEEKVSRITRDRRSKPAVFKEPYKREQRSLNENKESKQIIIVEKPYKCDVCQRSFSLKDHLIKHALTHTAGKRFKCDICKRSFSQKGHLTKHIRTHTGEKPYKCDICQRCFSVKGSLAQHNLTHTGEKPYKCDICQRKFRQKGSLTNHIRIHTGEKPYKCNICQRSFSQKTPLRNHILIHTGEKPYKCDVCQHGFSDRATLVKHSRIHTGVKPYKCEICQNSFNQKINLRNHIRTHTGEKPYKCDVCQKNFSQKVHLIKHMRVHA